ncbi:MAG: hypothetical protein EXS09_15240, partial [Gemmataceae bacterium]|nr:hypothetical protein [Gemmataceae bacterium]
RRVISAGQEGFLKVWDVANGKEEFRAEGHPKPVTEMALSADGNSLLTGGDDGTIRVWQVAE